MNTNLDFTIPDEPVEHCTICNSEDTYYLGDLLQCTDCDEINYQMFQLTREAALERLYYEGDFDLGICRP